MTASRPVRSWKRIDGPLFAERLEDERDPSLSPLILLHGFTQTRRSWDTFLDAIEDRSSSQRPVLRVDLPGHGESQSVVADLSTTADLVAQTCGSGIYCGYSMGGRVALHVAVQHPMKVAALITIGATAGVVDAEERRRRRESDDALADSIERMGTEAFIEQWLAQPMFAGLPRSRADTEQRRGNSPTGLAMSLRHAGTGTQEPLWERLSTLAMPVLLLAGSQDVKFSEIADRMAPCIGTNARSVHIAGAGHSTHLENPDGTARAIVEFIDPLP